MATCARDRYPDTMQRLNHTCTITECQIAPAGVSAAVRTFHAPERSAHVPCSTPQEVCMMPRRADPRFKASDILSSLCAGQELHVPRDQGPAGRRPHVLRAHRLRGRPLLPGVHPGQGRLPGAQPVRDGAFLRHTMATQTGGQTNRAGSEFGAGAAFRCSAGHPSSGLSLSVEPTVGRPVAAVPSLGRQLIHVESGRQTAVA